MQAELHDPETGAMRITTKHPKLLFSMLQGLHKDHTETQVIDAKTVILSERLYQELVRHKNGIPGPGPETPDLRREIGRKRSRETQTEEEQPRAVVCVGVQTQEFTGAPMSLFGEFPEKVAERQQEVGQEEEEEGEDPFQEPGTVRSHDTLPVAAAAVLLHKPPAPPSSIASGFSDMRQVELFRNRLAGSISLLSDPAEGS